MSSSNSNNYGKIPEHMPEHMRRAVRLSMKRGGAYNGLPLRSQTLRLLEVFVDFKYLKQDFIRFLRLIDTTFSEDFNEKLRRVIPNKEKYIEKEVMRLVLNAWKAWQESLGTSERARNDLTRLIENPGILISYQNQLFLKEIMKALDIKVSELRILNQVHDPNYGNTFTTTKAFIKHRNPLNRPSNQTLTTNIYASPAEDLITVIRGFLWPIYYNKNKKTLKLPWKRTIVPANVNVDVWSLNNFKTGNKVIGYGDPKYHRYMSQNTFTNVAGMTPAEAFFLRNFGNRRMFRDPFNRNKTVTQHDLRFVEINMNPRYNKAALKIQSLYRGGKYRNTQIKIANAAEKKSAAANRAAQRARANFNQAKKFRNLITRKRKR